MIHFAFITVQLTCVSPVLHHPYLASSSSPTSVLQFVPDITADRCNFRHLNAIGLQDLTSCFLYKLSSDFKILLIKKNISPMVVEYMECLNILLLSLSNCSVLLASLRFDMWQ